MNITIYLDNGMVAYHPDRHLIRDMGDSVHIMSENGDMNVYPWKNIEQIKVKEDKQWQ